MGNARLAWMASPGGVVRVTGSESDRARSIAGAEDQAKATIILCSGSGNRQKRDRNLHRKQYGQDKGHKLV